MAAKAKKSKKAKPPVSVDEFMASLASPLKPAVEALRRAILGADSRIEEGIKWNSPSFRRPGTDYFATVNVRPRDGVLLVLHRGAKVKDGSAGRPKIDDPKLLLEWLAADRCAVRFRDPADVRAKKAALQGIVRQWIETL